MKQPDFAARVDARGYKCPEPLMQLYAALASISAGEYVEFCADDTASWRDVRQMCRFLRHRLIASEKRTNGAFIMHIQKRDS